MIINFRIINTDNQDIFRGKNFTKGVLRYFPGSEVVVEGRKSHSHGRGHVYATLYIPEPESYIHISEKVEGLPEKEELEERDWSEGRFSTKIDLEDVSLFPPEKNLARELKRAKFRRCTLKAMKGEVPNLLLPVEPSQEEVVTH